MNGPMYLGSSLRLPARRLLERYVLRTEQYLLPNRELYVASAEICVILLSILCRLQVLTYLLDGGLYGA